MNQQILHLWLIQLILNRLLFSCPTQDIVRFNLLLAQAPTEGLRQDVKVEHIQLLECISWAGEFAKVGWSCVLFVFCDFAISVCYICHGFGAALNFASHCM